jgi:class 3 adenylate cyclase/CheY-like chemotaxis protein
MLPETLTLTLDDNDIHRTEQYRRSRSISVLSVLFTDIARSTQLLEHFGEPEYNEIRIKHDHLLTDIASRDNGGFVVKSTGDGLLAVFSEPSIAVERALEIQSALRGHAYLKERIGIDLGQVSRETQGGLVKDVFGRHVNRAARIQSLAEPEHVLVSFVVYDCAVGWLKKPDIQWANHGLVSLKGFAEKTWIHEPFNPHTTSPQALQHSAQESSALSESPVTARTRAVRTRAGHSVHSPEAWKPGVGTVSEAVFRLPTEFTTPARTRGAAKSSWFFPAIVWSTDPQEDYARAIRTASKTIGLPVEVLWMDDSPDPHPNWRRVLESAGCQVSVARTIPATQDKLSRKTYTALISNLVLERTPNAGLELLRWLLEIENPTPTIIFASMEDVLRCESEARQLGAFRCTFGGLSVLDAVLASAASARNFL